MSKEKKKKLFLVKFTVLSSLMLTEMENAKVNTPEAQQLKALLEKHLTMAYNSEMIRSTTFLQTLENRFDTNVRKAIQEFNIKV